MESSEHRGGVDRGARAEVRCPGWRAERGRAPLADALVRPRGVEVGAVLNENAFEMALCGFPRSSTARPSRSFTALR